MLKIQQLTSVMPQLSGKGLEQWSFIFLGGLITHPGISTSAWRKDFDYCLIVYFPEASATGKRRGDEKN